MMVCAGRRVHVRMRVRRGSKRGAASFAGARTHGSPRAARNERCAAAAGCGLERAWRSARTPASHVHAHPSLRAHPRWAHHADELVCRGPWREGGQRCVLAGAGGQQHHQAVRVVVQLGGGSGVGVRAGVGVHAGRAGRRGESAEWRAAGKAVACRLPRTRCRAQAGPMTRPRTSPLCEASAAPFWPHL